jgi:hypothetical protein
VLVAEAVFVLVFGVEVVGFFAGVLGAFALGDEAVVFFSGIGKGEENKIRL